MICKTREGRRISGAGCPSQEKEIKNGNLKSRESK
jgi:hypothetical protein